MLFNNRIGFFFVGIVFRDFDSVRELYVIVFVIIDI